jgi:transposase
MKIFMEEFSKQLKAYRVIMVMDGAAWHKSKQLGEFENIRTLYLPPYSPELNPVEHLWEHIRERYLRNSFWLSIEGLEEMLEKILHEICKSLKTVQTLVGFNWAII